MCKRLNRQTCANKENNITRIIETIVIDYHITFSGTNAASARFQTTPKLTIKDYIQQKPLVGNLGKKESQQVLIPCISCA